MPGNIKTQGGLQKTRDSKQKSGTDDTLNDRRNTKLRNKTSTSTTIVGDSLIRHLDCRRLRRSSKQKQVFAETYRGANIDAMKHHIKPCLMKKPDQLILYVGTNDLSDKNSTKIVNGIAEICEIIKTESPATEIVLSEIILRTDNVEFKQKIDEINNKILQYCDQYKLGLIKHNNIENKYINPYAVYLNRVGTSILARNILTYLNKKEDK